MAADMSSPTSQDVLELILALEALVEESADFFLPGSPLPASPSSV